MATYNKFNDFVLQLGKAVHNLDAAGNVLKVMLSNVAPVATNSIKVDITEIAAGNGYTAGGNTVTKTYTIAAGTATLAGDQSVFTAATAAMATFRYVVLYNSTPANGNLISWWDYGSALTLQVGESFTVKFNNQATGGAIFSLA